MVHFHPNYSIFLLHAYEFKSQKGHFQYSIHLGDNIQYLVNNIQ